MENAKPNSEIIAPIPKPRRIFLKKSQYENVTISKENSKNDSEINEKHLNSDNSFSNATVEISDCSNSKEINISSNINKEKVNISTLNDFHNNNAAKSTLCDLSGNSKSKEYEKIYLKKDSETPKNVVVLSSNNNSSVTSRASTPEPFYVNQNQYSSNIFNIDFLQDSNFDKPLPREVLYEFDPLMKHRSSTNNEISNELLLLENLLQDDIYGNVFGGLQLKFSPNQELSDDENSDEKFLPPIPTRVDSLELNSNEETFFKQENEDNQIRGPQEKQDNQVLCLPNSNAEKINNTSKSTINSVQQRTQTSWYLNENDNFSFQTDNISLNEPPPAYSENTNKSTFQNYITSVNDNISLGISGKHEINKMITNFCNKINVLKRKPSLKTANPKAENFVKKEIIPRPKLTEAMIRHEGFLIRFPSGAIEDIFKELQNRKAVIKDNKFYAFQESEQKNLKETIYLHEISTVQCLSNNKITENSTHYYCFEITTVTPKTMVQQKFLNSNSSSIKNNNMNGNFKAQRTTHLYGISKESERDLWIQKLLQGLTDVFPNHLTYQFYRAGWCYLKKSITAEWSGSWILLSKRKRKLVAFVESELCLEKLDLRKARCIILNEADSSVENLYIEKGPILMIDCPPFSLYLTMSCPRETKIWKHIIREVACNNGPNLDEQQLTKHNIPVIIDKCINFIYIHGSMTEGIYRKSGSENSIKKLIYDFRSNAFSVEITKTNYTEHDVASVLKRFMRNLPQRLLGKFSESFISVSQITSLNDKLMSYKELLGRLSSIEFMTTRKLINHLSFIESQSKNNKMTLENLAVMWGPTLLQTKTGDEHLEYNQESQVVTDLILNCKTLFPLSKDEINKEKSMLHYLKKYYAAFESLNELSVKQSGDLKVWIILKLESKEVKSEEEQNSLCVNLNPGKTAVDICKEISSKINRSYKELCLFENIFNDSLERPLHDEEKLFQTVLRWSYWPEEIRKNNILIMKSSKYLEKMSRTLNVMKNFSLKKTLLYADNKTKTLKLYEIELNGKKLFINKITKNGIVNQRILDLQDFSIYLGSERKISQSWALTFIENSQSLSLKNPESSFIGHIIAGDNKDDQIIAFSSIWNNIYGGIKKL